MIELLNDACPGLEWTRDPDLLESHGRDWTRFRAPAPAAVAFPRSVAEVQALVGAARRHGLALVPSGGRTGLSGGAVAAAGEVVVSFDRMRTIVDFDATDRLVTAEAGVTVAELQRFADEQGLFYPVSFAAEGSAQVGGSVATNAGGIRVLRYGLTRDWVAGLTVVDGRGEVLECNRGLVKNQSGYDLRHLFAGSEGTLGLIVAVTLELTDPPPPSQVMLLGLADLAAVMAVFAEFRAAVTLQAFEFLSDVAMDAVRAGHELPAPLEGRHPHYALLEYEQPDDSAEAAALACFERCLEAGWLVDGVVSQSGQQAAELWRYREGISEAISPRTPYKNDLSVRVSRVPDFLADLDRLVAERYPDFEVAWYGHIGDGNLHMNVLRPENMDLAEFEDACEAVNEPVFDLVARHGGSISAEHGIGLLKKPWLDRSRSAAEIEAMRGIKRVFDPDGVLNPGKVFDLSG